MVSNTTKCGGATPSSRGGTRRSGRAGQPTAPAALFATVMPEAKRTMVVTFQLSECGSCTMTFSRVLVSLGWLGFAFPGVVSTGRRRPVWKIRVTEWPALRWLKNQPLAPLTLTAWSPVFGNGFRSPSMRILSSKVPPFGVPILWSTRAVLSAEATSQPCGLVFRV